MENNQPVRQVYAEIVPMNEDVWFQKYKQLASTYEHVLLESGRSGRYHFVGLQPVATLRGKDDCFTVTTQGSTYTQYGDLLTLMKNWMKEITIEKIPDGPPFQGGAIGYLSYDLVRQMERIPNIAQDDLQMDDLYFYIFEEVACYDKQKNELWLMVIDTDQEHAYHRLKKQRSLWEKQGEKQEKELYTRTQSENFHIAFKEEQFIQAARKVQDYIARGEVFQVNLSVRQAQALKASPFHIYEAVRKINPSPYMAYLTTRDFQIICCSPELLIKKRGQAISTRPIGGTRSRGANATEDEMLEKTLLENEKERAEHVMLVDIERNDLGRVCEYGSIEVTELMTIEKYSHVMHLVSNVSGRLDTNKDVYDIIRATFPGGTITGAPKVRTMEIIEELEPTRRGIYTGSIGWIGFDGDMELNIVIRTMLVKDGIGYVQAGAGIVIDSDPKAEYKECLKKAKALLDAIELSEESLAEGERG